MYCHVWFFPEVKSWTPHILAYWSETNCYQSEQSQPAALRLNKRWWRAHERKILPLPSVASVASVFVVRQSGWLSCAVAEFARRQCTWCNLISDSHCHLEKRSEPIKNWQKLSDIGRLDIGGNTNKLLVDTVSLHIFWPGCTKLCCASELSYLF